MTKQEVLARLCTLATKVMRDKYNYDIPADCFCSEENNANFQFHPEIVAFIENAVNAELQS